MDTLNIPYGHVRAIGKASRKTGTTVVEYTPSDDPQQATFVCKGNDGKVRASGIALANGEAEFKTHPRRKPSKAAAAE